MANRDAVFLHRDITIRNLVREARRHEHELTPTENGGSRWTATGNDGCIARVNFPAPALISHISTEDQIFDKILGLASESLDESRYGRRR